MSLIGRLRLPLVPLVVLLAVAGVTVAAASPRTSATGSFSYKTFTPSSVRLVDGTTIIDYMLTSVWTGTFSGTSIAQGTLIIRADGSTFNRGCDTFTGTVNGVPGTVTLMEIGPGDSTSFHSTDVIVSGSGDLANLHGVLTALGTVTPTGLPTATYTGRIHFAEGDRRTERSTIQADQALATQSPGRCPIAERFGGTA